MRQTFNFAKNNDSVSVGIHCTQFPVNFLEDLFFKITASNVMVYVLIKN